VQPIQDKVYKAIQDYATSKGLDLILDKGSSAGVIFSNPTLDKTSDILKNWEYNNTFAAQSEK
jgi:outer membrane protein